MENVNGLSHQERFKKSTRLELGPHTITLEQIDGESESESEQGTIWNGGVVLARALAEGAVQEDWQHCRVLELGSGTGLCGIVAAKLGARETVLTDLAPLLPLLERNAAANAVSASAVPLD